MKSVNLKDAAISAVTVYALGISAYVGSFIVPFMDDPELQANLVLMAAIIPAACLGAHLYYRRGHETSGFVLGFVLFLSAIVLDATITVPVFIMPNGGNHLSFFGDPGFWLIGFEYMTVIAAYWQLRVIRAQTAQAR